jgi:thioesterase domain-containing protein
MRHVQGEGPYRIAGWSAGGTIAFEMARQLRDAGQEVAFLGLIDTSADYRALGLAAVPETGNADVDDVAAMLAGLPQHPLGEAMEQLRQTGDLAALFAQGRRSGMFPAELDDMSLRRQLAVRASIRRAVAAYALQPLDLPVSLFVAQQERRDDPALGWRATMGSRLDVVPVPGTHYSLMEPPQIQTLAAALSAALSTAQGGTVDVN